MFTLVVEPNAGNLGGNACPLTFNADDGVEKFIGSFLIASDDEFASLFINEVPCVLLEEEYLNVALGPSSFDMFSNAPAACATRFTLLLSLLEGVIVFKFDEELDEDLALESEDVVDNNNGEVIL